MSFEISNKGRPPQDLRWGPYAVVEREHSTILCLLGMNVLCFLLYCFYVLNYLEFSKDVIKGQCCPCIGHNWNQSLFQVCFQSFAISNYYKCFERCRDLRLHIPTRTVSCPVTTRTVSKKFPGNFLKFPKKLRALLPLAHYRKGNFPRFVYYFRLFCSMNSILIKYSYNCNKINMAKFTL